MDSKSIIFFSTFSGGLVIWDCSLNKNFKIYLGPMLPLGNRKWQLIYPKWCIWLFISNLVSEGNYNTTYNDFNFLYFTYNDGTYNTKYG